jgi:hypothetical protein
MSDSPNLSDLSEGRFDDINGGHRTSTPNMSKQKRSASLSTPEIKHIKKQIQGYFFVSIFVYLIVDV